MNEALISLAMYLATRLGGCSIGSKLGDKASCQRHVLVDQWAANVHSLVCESQ